MKLPRLLSLSLILVLVLVSSARAEWGWKMPNLNPFKQQDSHPAHIARDSKPQAGWHWLGAAKKPAAPAAPQPSMWQRMSSGTKSAWTKTKTTLNPWASKPKQEEEIVITGSNSYFSQMANTSTRQPAKKPMWAWGAEEDNEKPRKAGSVSDFIGAKRPE